MAFKMKRKGFPTRSSASALKHELPIQFSGDPEDARAHQRRHETDGEHGSAENPADNPNWEKGSNAFEVDPDLEEWEGNKKKIGGKIIHNVTYHPDGRVDKDRSAYMNPDGSHIPQ